MLQSRRAEDNVIKVRAEEKCPRQCPKMTAAEGCKERSTGVCGGKGVGGQSPGSQGGQLPLTTG